MEDEKRQFSFTLCDSCDPDWTTDDSDSSGSDSSPGAQGIIEIGEFNGQKCVIKRSQFVDNLIELEFMALKKIKDAKIPHIVQVLNDEFSPELITEYISGTDLKTRITCSKLDYQIKLNLIYQTLASVETMHLLTGISHNDLHFGNVLTRPSKCDVIVYQFPEKTFIFETRGIEPVIIDFGLAFVPDTRMMAPLCFIDEGGYFPHCADFLSDARIFLTSAKFNLIRDRKIESVAQFVKLVEDLVINPLNLTDGIFQPKTFSNVFYRLQYTIRIGADTEKITQKHLTHYKNKIIDELLELFIGQIHLPLTDGSEFDLELTDKENDAIESIIQKSRIGNNKNRACVKVLFDEFNGEYEKFIRFKKHRKLVNRLLAVKNVIENKIVFPSLKRTIDRLIIAIHRYIYPDLKAVEEKKQELYQKLTVKSIVDILTLLPREKVVFHEKLSVQIINIREKTNVIECVTSENLALFQEIEKSQS